MMTLKKAEDNLHDSFAKIEKTTFSDKNLIFDFDEYLKIQFATLKRSAYLSSEHLKLEAIKQYCYDIKSIKGNLFLVSDKMLKLVRAMDIKTSFGASIEPMQQLYGIYHLDEYALDGSSPIGIVFNDRELKKILQLYDTLQYLSPYPKYNLEYGDKYCFDDISMNSSCFIGWDDDIFCLLENNSDPDIYWNLNDYL